ncbi:hypothetical protein FRC17_007407, partial [Serendipita sp. 399]
MEFFHCLNRTIAGVIPIVDPTVVIHYRRSPGQIAGIVVGTIVPVLLIVATAVFWFVRRRKAQRAEAEMVATVRLGAAEMPDESDRFVVRHATLSIPHSNYQSLDQQSYPNTSTCPPAPTKAHADFISPPTPLEINQPLPQEYTKSPRSDLLSPFRKAVEENPEQALITLLPGANQALLRDSLRREVISAGWWLENKPEPARILNEFVQRLSNKHFECKICGRK